MLFGLELKAWLGFTVVAAVISTFGSLVGILMKEYIFSRSFERWKQRQTLELLYEKFRDPLTLSARELASRVSEILEDYPTVYLKTEILASRPERQIHNSTDDKYFRRYKLVSTAYRFCSFLGWLELYRQENTYLHSGNNEHSNALETAVGLIRSDLADGHLNEAEDWLDWRDTLIFREELRAIGESMIEVRGATRTVMGYCRFVELIESNVPSSTQRWSNVALNFMLDLEAERRDFRQIRLKRLLVHLVELLKLLDAKSINNHILESRDKWAAEI